MYYDNPERKRNYEFGEEWAPNILEYLGITSIVKNIDESFKSFDFYGETKTGKKIRIEFQKFKSFEKTINGAKEKVVPLKSHKIYNLENNRCDLIINVFDKEITLFYGKLNKGKEFDFGEYLETFKKWNEHKMGCLVIPNKIIEIDISKINQ